MHTPTRIFEIVSLSRIQDGYAGITELEVWLMRRWMHNPERSTMTSLEEDSGAVINVYGADLRSGHELPRSLVGRGNEMGL